MVIPRARLLRRGFVLEYVTLGWNAAGIFVLAIAAVRPGRWRWPVSAWIPSSRSRVDGGDMGAIGHRRGRQRRGLRLSGTRLAGWPSACSSSPTVVLAVGYHPGTPFRDHVDRGDRGSHVRAGGREGRDRARARQPGAAHRGPGDLIDGILANRRAGRPGGEPVGRAGGRPTPPPGTCWATTARGRCGGSSSPGTGPPAPASSPPKPGRRAPGLGGRRVEGI